jgi:AraC-like DNA-binding protein
MPGDGPYSRNMPITNDSTINATASHLGLCRFSSDDLPVADRVPFYCDVVGRMLAKVDVEPVDGNFFCNARFCRFPDLSVSYVASSAIRGTRTREMAEGDQGLTLITNLGGAATLSHLHRDATLSAGGAILISNAASFCMQRTRSQRINVGVPHAVLAPMLANSDTALMSVIPGTSGPLRLLTGYINLLFTDSKLLETAELRRLAVNHVHDLVALTVGATRDTTEIAAGRGLRAARMQAIRTDIGQNLAGDVTVAALSARHRLSPRYIRKLFEGENTSLSQFVLSQRLTRVHRMLTDPRYASLTIGGIAFAVGFGDLSTFNRDFRRRFGVTPSDVRRGTQ